MILFWLLWATLIVALMVASYTDMKRLEIPNWLVLTGSVVGALEHGIYQGGHGIASHVFIGSKYLFFGVIWFAFGPLLSKVTKFQSGDAKLLAMIAVYTGMLGVPLILLCAMFVQLVIYLVRFAMGKMTLQVPFAPAIFIGSIGYLIGLLAGMKGGF